MSGNICAATNSPSPCSKATTTSSTNPAPRGASSPTTPNASHQSHPELGRRSILEADGIIHLNIILGFRINRRLVDLTQLLASGGIWPTHIDGRSIEPVLD